MIDYGKILPKKIVDIPKSGIRKYFDMITPDMKDVISLTVGQPDFCYSLAYSRGGYSKS